MKIFYVLLTLLIFLVHLQSRLIGVVHLNRHGVRTPKTFHSKTSESFFGATKGQLTINGMRQLQLMGQWDRRRYISKLHLLDSEFNSTQVKFKSSPTSRTIFSASGFISGMYPASIVKAKYKHGEYIEDDTIPNPDQELGELEEEEKSNDIEISIQDRMTDSLFSAHVCLLNKTKVSQLMPRVNLFKITPDEVRRATEDINSFFKFEKPKEKPDLNFLQELIQFLIAFDYHKKDKISKKLSPSTLLIIKMMRISRFWSTRLENSKGLKLSLSQMFTKFRSYLKKFKNEDGIKFVFLSGHDTNISSFLANMLDFDYLRAKIRSALSNKDDFNFLVSEFSSNIIIELHYNETIEDYFVKIMYNGKELTEGFKKGLVYEPKYQGIYYQNFKKILKTRIDLDFQKLECGQFPE